MKRRVYELSGGEQQRVTWPQSGGRLLCSTSLGSLDRALRGVDVELRTILKRVWRHPVTRPAGGVYIADQVVILNWGGSNSRDTDRLPS
jgi:translation initiation factor RLI1